MKFKTWGLAGAGILAGLVLAAGIRLGTDAVLAQTAFYQKLAIGATPCMVSGGANTPEAAVTGSPCDLFLRNNGAAGTTFYVKETGAASNTGWGAAVTATTIETYTVNLPAAVCDHNSGVTLWSTGAGAGYPTEVCNVAGTTLYADLAFSEAGSERANTHLMLPATWTSTVDLTIKWYTTATAGNVVWQIQTVCIADNEAVGAAWNAAQIITDAALANASRLNVATLTGVTMTGCAAGEELWINLLRDPAHASDTIAATADFVGMTLTLRRTM